MMSMSRRFLVVAVLALVGWIGVPGVAHASFSCSIKANPTLAFGSMSLPLNSNTTSTQVQVECTRTGANTGTTVSVCIGTSDNTAPRTMTNANPALGTLSYNIYSDAAYSQTLTPTSTATASMTLTNNNIPYEIDVWLYGKLSATQPSTAFGNYSGAVTATFSAGASCSSPDSQGTFTINATANLQGSCTISATPLNFGAQTSLGANIDRQATLTLTCTNGTPYTVKLNGGTAGSFSPRKLYLNGTGPQTVNYNLYTDSARGIVWGDGSGGSSTQIGTGTGSGQGNPQSLTVYGRVPVQAGGFTAGTYKDTVIATVEF